MMKSAAAMMKNMRPEEMQRMMEMAQRMQSGQQAGGMVLTAAVWQTAWQMQGKC